VTVQPVLPPGPIKHPLSSGLIHDLRTPLNQIIGYSQMLEEQAQEAGQDSFVPDLLRVRIAGQQLLGLLSTHFCSDGHLEAPLSAESTTALPFIPTGYQPKLEAVPDKPSAEEQNLATVPRHMLVVDDVEANRDVLSRRLRRQGFEVVTAINGLEAMDLLHANSFDLVLLDIMMPEMDGYEVLRRMKADERLKFIPVIMISALTELDSVVRCIEMGAEDYLHKPFDPTLLKARIGACLGKKLAHDREAFLFDQLRQSFKKLEELEKLRDNLTDMIVHDLRTPLSSVIVGMRMLDSLGDLNDDQREMANISISGGETLLGMVNDLLDVEKMESGTMQLECSELNVSQLIDVSVAQVASLSDEKKLKVVKDIGPNVTVFRGDENKLIRTLVNLLGNAIKFTPEQGTITADVRLGRDPRMLEFSISDTGEGIPEEAFERIFEKFGQVAERQAGRMMSTGLGLTFCKLAVEAHGGQIGVESTTGQGSRFWFSIPIRLSSA